VHTANQLIKNHNYADAAQLLLNTARNHASSPESQQQLLKASQTVQQIDDAVNAVKQGQYSEGIAKAGELLGTPLDDQSRQVLTELQNYAEDAKTLTDLIKSGAPQDVIKEIKRRMDEQVVIYNLMNPAAA
jgi:predicted Zn-dependent protease